MAGSLIVEGLTKKYLNSDSPVTAVDGVSLTLKSGEMLAVTGPSGSGKTTLLSMIGGIIKPTSGKIIIDDINIAESDEKELARLRRQKIGFVFQQHNLLPYMTVLQNILLPAEINGTLNEETHQNALRLLDELGLAGKLNKVPAELSGGEKQRVAIGRAFTNNPSLVLIDEPTASLDTQRGEQVVKGIAEQVQRRGKIGIMVTHDLRMCKYADRNMTIRDGRIVEGALA